jgi:hypothetical protein
LDAEDASGVAAGKRWPLGDGPVAMARWSNPVATTGGQVMALLAVPAPD